MQHTLAIEDLLERPDWIRDLAYSLVSDAATADDLIQDAWACALQSVSAEVSDPRGWFAKILRNLAHKHWRTTSRRETREAHSARKEALPSAADLVSRVSQQRDLIGNVLALPASPRDVLILRYFEDCSLAEIAKRLEIPLATAESRLQRAKASLRDRLDAEYGDRSTWCAALMPLAISSKLAKGAGLATGAAAGTLVGVHSLFGGALSGLAALMSRTWFQLALPVSLALAAFFALSNGDPVDMGSRPEIRESLFPPTENSSPPSELAALTEVEPLRIPLGASPPEAHTGSPTVTYNGRLIGPDGSPIGNARIGWVTPETVHWLPHPGSPVLGNGLRRRPFKASTLDQIIDPASELPALLGKVTEEEFPEWLAGYMDTAPMLAESRTDAQGRFTLNIPEPWEEDGTPIGNPRLILDGHILHSVGWAPIDSGGRERTVLALPTANVSGQVFDQEGAPVPRFRFRQMAESSSIHGLPIILVDEEFSPWQKNQFQTDLEGRFDLRAVYAVPGLKLEFASRKLGGHVEPILPGQVSDLSIQLLPFHILKEVEQSIHGVILGPDGEPHSGARVSHPMTSTQSAANGNFSLKWIPGDKPVTVTVTARGHVPRVTVVDAPSEGKRDRMKLYLGDPSLTISGTLVTPSGVPLPGYEVTLFDPTFVPGSAVTEEEYTSLGAPQPLTDAAGQFSIFGLQNREYRLLFWNNLTSERYVSAPIQAGETGIFLQHKPGDIHGPIDGRVVDSDGNGVAGVEIRGGFRYVADPESGSPPGWQVKKTWEAEVSTKTDANGDFTLQDLPKAFEFVLVSGSGLEPLKLAITPGDSRNLRIEVSHLYGFRFSPESVVAYTRLEVYDAQGSRLAIFTDTSGELATKRARLEVKRHGGDFPFCEVPVSARSVTLFAKDGSTLDVLLDPKPGAADVLLP